jgi:hypothetical protein
VLIFLTLAAITYFLSPFSPSSQFCKVLVKYYYADPMNSSIVAWTTETLCPPPKCGGKRCMNEAEAAHILTEELAHMKMIWSIVQDWEVHSAMFFVTRERGFTSFVKFD